MVGVDGTPSGDSGSPSGNIVETTTGENRIGGSYSRAIYSINAKVLTDANGNNCSISSSTAQFQCTSNSTATLFTLGDSSDLLYDDTNANFLACPADDGSFNIFSDAKEDKTGCGVIKLIYGGFSCAALGRPSSSSSSAVPSATSTTSPRSTSAASCPKNIDSGSFQFPHLIVPTSPQAPDYAFGNSYTAHITSTNTTLFNFDVPSTAPYTGTCALVFLFPFASATQSGSYTFTGIEEEEGEKGGLDFALLSGIATAGTTYKSTPTVATNYGTTEILPGNNYTIATFPCAAGKTVTYSGSSVGGVGLSYFENSAPSAIGLYMVPCV
ncbi:gpi anchored cell wall protein [Rutstroemia sp. NJR-2017a BBW]|nr:gpi anchored cell wall protein [Rutstroemia sp. NJR-2017a BBW]